MSYTSFLVLEKTKIKQKKNDFMFYGLISLRKNGLCN